MPSIFGRNVSVKRATLIQKGRKKEEGRRKKEEGRRKKEEGRRKKEEGRKKMANTVSFLAIRILGLIR
ncbi:hypothetical protein [Phormidium nigroviride]